VSICHIMTMSACMCLCNKDYRQCNQNLPLVGARVSIYATLGKWEAWQRLKLRKPLGRYEILPIGHFYVHATGK